MVIVFGSLAMIFVLTTLLIKDLLKVHGAVYGGVFGIITGPFAFWWAFGFISNKPKKKLILYTAIIVRFYWQ